MTTTEPDFLDDLPRCQAETVVPMVFPGEVYGWARMSCVLPDEHEGDHEGQEPNGDPFWWSDEDAAAWAVQDQELPR